MLEKAQVIRKIGFGRMVQGAANRILPPGTTIDHHVLNANGDELNNVSTEKSIRDVSTIQPARFHDTDKGRLSIIRDFVTWSRRNNVTVVGAYPPMIDFEGYQNNENRIFFGKIGEFWESVGVTTLAAPLDFLYPRSLMYNTGYHLNDVGATLHTQ